MLYICAHFRPLEIPSYFWYRVALSKEFRLARCETRSKKYLLFLYVRLFRGNAHAFRTHAIVDMNVSM